MEDLLITEMINNNTNYCESRLENTINNKNYVKK